MTLSEFSYYLRRYGPIIFLAIILFLVFFFIIRLIVIQITSKPVIVPFVPQYGNLKEIDFPISVEYPQNPEFTIDNIEGRPVTATGSAEIFPMPAPTTRFSYAQTISLMGRAVGFDPESERYVLTETTAQFDNEQQSLEIDIANFNYSFAVKYENQPEIFEETIIPDLAVISEQARTHLRTMDRYPDDLARGAENIIYLRFEPGAVEPTVVNTAEEANAVEVQLYPPDINRLPMVPPGFFRSQNFVVLVFKQNGAKVIKSQVKYFERDYFGASYPLKTGDEAWNELISGQGTIVSAGVNSNQITITEMFLGYYDPDDYQDFLQPVYVFLGNNNFAAYVPAVQNQYVGEQPVVTEALPQ